MRNVLTVVSLFLLNVGIANAQVQVGPGSSYRFDQSTTDVVTRFELQVDNGTWTPIGLPPVVTDPAGGGGNTTYAHPVGNLTSGNHTVKVRACNTLGCGPETASVAFRMVLIPGMPNLRITPILSGTGVVMNRYRFGGIEVLDVFFKDIDTTIQIGAPTFNIPGVYNARKGDWVALALGR